MQSSHEDIIAELLAAWNEHDAGRVATLYSTQHEGFDSGLREPLKGAAAVQSYYADFLRAFPDSRIRAEEVVREGNRYVVAWQAEGTHLAKLMNIPPSGKYVRIRGISILTVKDGKFIRSDTIWDMAALLRTIGLLPRLVR